MSVSSIARSAAGGGFLSAIRDTFNLIKKS